MKARLIDEAQFIATAGKGGDGAISFRREKYIRKGGPDGGDGGHGGSIRIVADAQLNTLKTFAGKDRFAADPGRPGLGAKRIGWDAEDKVLKIPIGTVVLIKYPGRLLMGRPFYGEMADAAQRHGLSPDPAPYRSFEERWPNGRGPALAGPKLGRDDRAPTKPGDWVQVADMQKDGEEIVLARGGRGGLGNARFAHSRLTTPKLAQQGELGEKFEVRLELKLLADVGLIGLPNVGKSTLLSLLTAARPEIADYQFTTLSPNLGVLRQAQDKLDLPRGESSSHLGGGIVGKRVIIADIPGLIEDASKGKGLGIAFLKHVERCTLLLHVLAPGVGVNDHSPDILWRNYQTVRKELGVFNEKMLEKPELVVVNKIDLITDGGLQITDYFKNKGVNIILVSAVTGEGLEELRQEIESLASEN